MINYEGNVEMSLVNQNIKIDATFKVMAMK